MILIVEDCPEPLTISSDLTGRNPKQRSGTMPTTVRRRKRKRSKGRSSATRRKTRKRRRVTARKRKNPRRKSRTAARTTKHRPRLSRRKGRWYGGRSKRSLIRRGSGTRVNRKRRVRRRVRRNPNGVRGITRTMFNQKTLMATAKAGAGIAIGFSAMPIFYKILPAQLKDQRRWLGGVHVALGLAIAGFVRNRDVKDIGMVIAATGAYDLIAMNFDFLGLPPLRTTSQLADRLIPGPVAPAAPAAPASPEEAAGCYGGQLDLTHYGSSYPVSAAPVSPVAATGVGASFERVGSSYPSLAYPTIGLSGDGGEDMGWEDMIN